MLTALTIVRTIEGKAKESAPAFASGSLLYWACPFFRARSCAPRPRGSCRQILRGMPGSPPIHKQLLAGLGGRAGAPVTLAGEGVHSRLPAQCSP